MEEDVERCYVGIKMGCRLPLDLIITTKDGECQTNPGSDAYDLEHTKVLCR